MDFRYWMNRGDANGPRLALVRAGRDADGLRRDSQQFARRRRWPGSAAIFRGPGTQAAKSGFEATPAVPPLPSLEAATGWSRVLARGPKFLLSLWATP